MTPHAGAGIHKGDASPYRGWKGKSPKAAKVSLLDASPNGKFCRGRMGEGGKKRSEVHRYSLETERGRISGFAGEKVQVGSIRSIRFEKVGADVEQGRFHAHAHA